MSAHLPSEVPPERASLPGPVGAAGAAVHLPAAPLANPGAGVDRSASERAWSRPAGERWRARTAVAAELARTLVLGAAGSGGLFALLGGARLLRRAQPVGGTVGVGAVVVGLALLLLGLWAQRQAAGAAELLRDASEPAAGGPKSALALLTARPPEPGAEGAAARGRRAQHLIQRLPYSFAVGFLGAGVLGGAAAAARLNGLRTEDRVLAALLWGFCFGVAALAVALRLRSFLAPLAQALQARTKTAVKPLLSVRSKLLCGVGWLLLCVTSLSLLKRLLLSQGVGDGHGLLNGHLGGHLGGHLDGHIDSLALRGLLSVLPVQVAAAGGVVALAVVALAWPVRDLLRRAAAVVGHARGGRGELQRPIILGVAATAEVLELQRLFEQLRRLLLARLRSSTEQNLQLEAEVARRSTELSRRNDELADALARLQCAREELLRAEKLATVGRIAAGITSEIDAPVARMTGCCAQLTAAVQELVGGLSGPNAALAAAPPAPRLELALAELTALTDGAERVRDIVRAMRVYVRPGETQPGPCNVEDIIEDVRQLFGEPFRHCIEVRRDGPTAAPESQVVTVRSDLALLLASWLGRVEPRLRDRPAPRVVVRTRRFAAPDPERRTSATVCEITLHDNGRPLTASEQAEPVGPELLRRLGAQVWVRCSSTGEGGSADSAAGQAPQRVAAEQLSSTVLTVRLPAASPGSLAPPASR